MPGNPNPDSDGPSRPLRRDAQRNRDLLVAAAREIFARRGLEASMDDIARHAGLGVGTAYRHFANKYELADEILAQAVDGVVRLAEECLRNEDPWQSLVQLVEGAMVAQTSDRALREILMGVRDTGAEESRDRIAAAFQPVFDRARNAGVLRADVESSDVALVVFMLCTLADASVDVQPFLWRRYLPSMMAGLRQGSERPDEPALPTDRMRAALAGLRRRQSRGTSAGATTADQAAAEQAAAERPADEQTGDDDESPASERPPAAVATPTAGQTFSAGLEQPPVTEG